MSAAEDNAKGLQDQLKERDKDMKQLKQDAEGNADLQQKYSDLDSKYKTQQKEHEQQLKTMQLDHAIEMHLSGKVHDAGIVSSLLDKSKLGLGDNGAVTGLDEQLTALKESKGFLFAPEKAVEPTMHRLTNKVCKNATVKTDCYSLKNYGTLHQTHF